MSDILSGISAVSTLVDNIMARIWPTPEQRASADAIRIRSEIEQMMAPLQQQLEINKIEAASASRFVAGWRPAVGWVGVFSLTWNYVVAPMFNWILLAFHLQAPPAPVLDGTMASLLFGLLGLNIGARTLEKVQNVAAAASGPIRRS